MKQYKAYLFDFDYTLADSSRGIVMCFRDVLARHGYASVSDDEIRRTIGKTLEESFAILSGVTDADRLELFRKEYVAKADSCMTANTRFFPETVGVLRKLKGNGAKIAVISTKYRYRILEFTDKAIGENFFDMVVGGEDVSQPKPSPEGVWLAMRHLGCGVGECLYVGDSIVDAGTARSANVDFAGVLHGTTTRSELAVFPHVDIMDSLNGLV